MVSLGPPTGWTPSEPPAATLGPAATPGHPAAPAPAATTAQAPAAAPAPASEWRSEGSVLLGLDLVRSVFDASGSPTAQVKAKVIGWLPAAVSDYVDGAGKPAALYRICYLDGTVRGDVEDLVEDEVRGSVPLAPLPKRRKISVGDRVSLTLDPLESVVTKTGSGWYTVKFEFGGVDNFRADELRVL